MAGTSVALDFSVYGDLRAAGSGHLGITGTRARVDRIGGTMSIASEPGHGTAVRVSLPVA
jgi:signal transduction histidine kinase